ncbi:hypothetical protein C1702_18180 [Caldimonas thermodepolymerans]|nr:hypothetical protein C1702_18180 [Caldimonas thermodepolymerans]
MYRGVPRQYFHLYLAEVCYRFNHRHENLQGLSEFLCVRRFLNLSSCRSARREGEAVSVQYRELVHR